MEKSRNKQFKSLKSHAILNSMMKSHAILPCLTWDMNHPVVPCVHTVYTASL